MSTTEPSFPAGLADGADPSRTVSRAQSYSAYIKLGFYFTLGVVALLVVADVARVVLSAAGDIILPFVLGTAFALLIDPLVERVQRVTKLPRGPVAVLIFLLLIILLIAFISVVIPALVAQATAFADNGPAYIARLQVTVDGFLKHHHKIASIKMPKNFMALEATLSAKAAALAQSSSAQITAFLIGWATLMVQLVLSLIVTLFLLIDLKRLRARLYFLAPQNWRAPMQRYAADIGGVFSDYVRGLIIVCTMYGAATIVLLYGLAIIHHPLAQYALLVGAIAGVLYSVPYLGSITTTVVIFIVGFASGGAGFGGITVIAGLALNQIFDNIVTPKVVGGGVGLHPVIALFALLLGGEMFGIWGMLLSVPVAASIQVILFRLFPRTITPTPPEFLRAQGVPPIEGESLKVDAGEDSPSAERERVNAGG